MTLISRKTVIPFKGEHRFIVSPLMKYQDDVGAAIGSREVQFMRLHGKLLYGGDLRYSGGIIRFVMVSSKIVEDERYWGGDGIPVSISVNYTGRDLSKALGDEVVVFNEVSNNYYRLGYCIPVNSNVHILCPKPRD